MADVEIYKNRTNVVRLDLGIDVSGDTITSEIRAKVGVDSPLLGTWVVSFLTDGTDGKLILTIDDSQLTDISAKNGYMDVKRLSAGEPLQIFDPIKVVFKEVVTA